MSDWKKELKELISLREMGALSDVEFEVEKRKIMASRPQSAVPSSPSIFTKMGSYKILEKIGEGGMGAVYKAIHQNDYIAKQQGEVALKVMHSQYAENEQLRERFNREATVCMKLQHKGIVKVYDIIEEQGRLGLVMELVSGRPLSVIIGKEVGPIPWERAQPIFFQVLDAVSYAHKNGVIHRDIKPENIMVTENKVVKILDFGIAKDLQSGQTKTGTGMGTVGYMAPEQFTNAKAVDHRSDIYALGMTLYEMVAGRLPWEEKETEYSIMRMKDEGNLPPPTAYYPYIPDNVVAMIEQSLETNINSRLDSCEGCRLVLSNNDYVGISKQTTNTTQSKQHHKAPKQQKSGLLSNTIRGFDKLSVRKKIQLISEALGKGGHTFTRKDIATRAQEEGIYTLLVLPDDYCDNKPTGRYSKQSFLHSVGYEKYVLSSYGKNKPPKGSYSNKRIIDSNTQTNDYIYGLEEPELDPQTNRSIQWSKPSSTKKPASSAQLAAPKTLTIIELKYNYYKFDIEPITQKQIITFFRKFLKKKTTKVTEVKVEEWQGKMIVSIGYKLGKFDSSKVPNFASYTIITNNNGVSIENTRLVDGFRRAGVIAFFLDHFWELLIVAVLALSCVACTYGFGIILIIIMIWSNLRDERKKNRELITEIGNQLKCNIIDLT
jgi:serine/threonine protein kinase